MPCQRDKSVYLKNAIEIYKKGGSYLSGDSEDSEDKSPNDDLS